MGVSKYRGGPPKASIFYRIFMDFSLFSPSILGAFPLFLSAKVQDSLGSPSFYDGRLQPSNVKQAPGSPVTPQKWCGSFGKVNNIEDDASWVFGFPMD